MKLISLRKSLCLLLIEFVFLAGGHIADVANIAGMESLTNGFFNVSASRAFHIGLYMMYASFIAVAILAVLEDKNGGKQCKEKKKGRNGN